MAKANRARIADQPESSRRGFLTRIWMGLGFVALAEVAGVSIAFLRPRKQSAAARELESVIVAGPVDDFSPNSVTAFTRGRFYLSRLDDGGFLALSCRCTHLGCTVPWVSAENKFVCPCHASTFDISGNVITAPAPRALDMYRVSIENNIVKVDTRESIRRTEFREEQVAYPEKI